MPRGRSKWFQYTAIDDCTRVRVLRLYRRQNHRSSLAFLCELTAAFPFQIRKIQVDNGTEFPLAFALTCQELGVRVRYIRPRRPEQNGKVERSHQIDDEELWHRYLGQDFDAAIGDLAAWEYRYNHERFSMALKWPHAAGEARGDAGPAAHHHVDSSQRPVSEHTLLNRQGGRAQRTAKRWDLRISYGARS